jgi:predicted patatin/cPLA2 family phospholipase
MFGTDTLRHRDTAKQLVDSLPQETQVIIDFANISFASRSFLHELLCRLDGRKVIFKNKNEEVTKMMEIAQTGTIPKIC